MLFALLLIIPLSLRSQNHSPLVGTFLIIVYGTPIAPGRCRLFLRGAIICKSVWARRLLQLMRPQWVGHLGNLDVFNDDDVFLHIGARARAPPSCALRQGCRIPEQPDPCTVKLLLLIPVHRVVPQEKTLQAEMDKGLTFEQVCGEALESCMHGAHALQAVAAGPLRPAVLLCSLRTAAVSSANTTQAAYNPTPADTFVLALHKWRRMAGAVPWAPGTPTKIPQEPIRPRQVGSAAARSAMLAARGLRVAGVCLFGCELLILSCSLLLPSVLSKILLDTWWPGGSGQV